MKDFKRHEIVSIRYGHEYEGSTGFIESIDYERGEVELELSHLDDHKTLHLSIDQVEKL